MPKRKLPQLVVCFKIPSIHNVIVSKTIISSRLKELATVLLILDWDQRAINAIKALMKEVANDLPTEYGEEPFDKCWVDNFILRIPEIDIQRS